ncbi:MAG: hypothetical protein WCK05_06685 [Planctomycetota bacterium]
MSDYDDYRPSSIIRWLSRANPLSALWLTLLCLTGIAWLVWRHAQGGSTIWTLLTQICLLLTFAASPWCRYGIARDVKAKKLLFLLPIFLLMLALAFFRHGLSHRGATSAPAVAQTSSRPGSPASAPAQPADQ